MIFRQFFEPVSSSYTYLLAARKGGEALLVDPVLERVDRYIRLLDELDLKLVKVFDTHVHADHITGMGALRDRTKCITIMGEQSPVDVVSVRVGDGDTIEIEGLSLEAMYTPGHTMDSYCLRMADRVFTGDTLFIRGTGRTDFQGGSSRDAYDSLFNKLLTLPDETLVYPGHDYKGDTVSTIGEERAHNPRLQVGSADEYAAIMDNLNLPDPKMMDVAVPANVAIGRGQGVARYAAWALTADQVMDQCKAAPMSLWSISVTRPSVWLTASSRAPSTRPIPGSNRSSSRSPIRQEGRRAYSLRRRARPARRDPIRHAARDGRNDGPPADLLLRLRRALGDGGREFPGMRSRQTAAASVCHLIGGRPDRWPGLAKRESALAPIGRGCLEPLSWASPHPPRPCPSARCAA